MTYQNTITQMQGIVAANGPSWAAIDPESAARMVIQNRFRTGLDIAKYTAGIMRADMAAYDAASRCAAITDTRTIGSPGSIRP